MRQVVSAVLVVLTLAISAPFVGADPSAATLIGQLVDAGGRGAVGRSVELVRDGAVVTTMMTTANGDFMFAGIAPGSYVVRTMVNNRAAGTKVAVKAGESIPVTVVLPSLATASPQIGAAFGLMSSMAMSGGLAVTNQLFTNALQNQDITFVQSITNLQITTFFQNIQNLNNFNADFLARQFHIGPYGTF